MTLHVQLVFLFTFIIHLISTLAYALRIAGVRTGRIAVSFALFNVLILFSRTSNTFQAPLLAKHVERSILGGAASNIETDLRWMIVAASLATIVGIVANPDVSASVHEGHRIIWELPFNSAPVAPRLYSLRFAAYCRGCQHAHPEKF